MELITPGVGLIFWTSLFFLIVLVLLRKLAWNPIVSALNEREESIKSALESASKAREEMSNLKAENEKILQEARTERDRILREAKAAADKVVAESQERASQESQRIIKSAQEAIENEKQAALTEVKNQIAQLSLTLAETILRKKISDEQSHIALIEEYMKDLKLN